MLIQALGGCCRRSQQNYENAVKAAAAAGGTAVVEHVTDPEKILAMGVMATPGIAIDGHVTASGRVATVAQILEMIARRQTVREPKPEPCCEDHDTCCEDGRCECTDEGKCVCDGENRGKSGCCDDRDACCGHGKE